MSCSHKFFYLVHTIFLVLPRPFSSLTRNNVYFISGLTKQIVASLYKNNIKRLTKTFLTLSLADVASRVQLGTPVQAEIYILKMVRIHSKLLKNRLQFDWLTCQLDIEYRIDYRVHRPICLMEFYLGNGSYIASVV